MLFDISSPGRKNVVRVVYSVLAALFLIGFVGFGVGGELGGGGIIDGIFGGDSGSTSDALEQQIEDAEDDVESNPGDPQSLSALILLRAQSGNQQLEIDEQTGVPIGLSENSRAEYEDAISLWQDYLDADPNRVDLATASAIVQAYRFLGNTDGAIEAQELLAKSNPTGSSFGSLAQLYYIDLDIKQGDKARDRALEESSKSGAKTIESQLVGVRRQAVMAKKQQAQQPDLPAGEGSPLGDPFGGLTPTDPGAAPVAP